MTDPTELVLTGGFAVAFGTFVIAAVIQFISKRNPSLSTLEDFNSTEEISPYQTAGVDVVPPGLPVGKVPIWFYQPFDLAGIGGVFLIFAWFFLMTMAGSPDQVAVLNSSVLLVNIGVQFGIAGAVTVIATRRVRLGSWLGLRWPTWHWVFLIAPGAVAFMLAVFKGLEISGYIKWMESLGVETVQDTVKLLQKSEDPLVLGLMAAAAVIVAPLCEEIVFRGYFYPVMKKFAGAWPAAVCSAMVFAAAHGNLTAFLPLFIFGCLLVLVYENTGSIWAPMSVHFCFNSVTVIAQMVARHYDLPLGPTP